MKPRRLSICLAVPIAWFALIPTANAHRLDEYLQATLLSVDTDHVDLEINLTPGVALASEVFAWIDTDHDHAISPTEGEAYARQMLRSVTLSVDNRPVPVALLDASFPQFEDMSLGVGTIHLRATATIPATGAGFHQLSLLNTHRPERSVYLVNALVPANPRIRLADQQRDFLQHRLTLNYTIASDAPPAWVLPLLGGLVGAFLIGRLVLTQVSVAPSFWRTLHR